jgi:HEPN domain-containing protein/predicted nucleotidyltransferase
MAKFLANENMPGAAVEATRRRRSAMPALIARMVQRIVKKFDPEQVILFGSQARGDAGPDSDVDLLVVMDGEGSRRENALEIQCALHAFRVPLDVIVTSPEEFAWRKDVVGTIEWPASREGKVLYAREPSSEPPPVKGRCCMPTPEVVIRVIREWLRKADNDLKTAAHTLTLGKDCPTETVSFHAQQCIEKYIKALLVFRATPFPKTHDIHELRALLPPKLRPRLDRKVQKRLTEYAAVLRYPESGPDIPLAEARQAVAIARRVRKEVRRHLPRAALRREKK